VETGAWGNGRKSPSGEREENLGDGKRQDKDGRSEGGAARGDKKEGRKEENSRKISLHTRPRKRRGPLGETTRGGGALKANSISAKRGQKEAPCRRSDFGIAKPGDWRIASESVGKFWQESVNSDTGRRGAVANLGLRSSGRRRVGKSTQGGRRG